LYLFVIENRQRLGVYYSTRLFPATPSFISEYEGLIHPVRVAVSKRDSTFVVVADSGDMRCKIYYYFGGSPLHSFTDSLWQSFSGLAVDRALNIYVADAGRDTIQAYNRWGQRLRVVSEYGSGYGYVIDPGGLAALDGMLVVADVGKNWVQRLRSDTTNVAAILEPIGLEEDLLLDPQDVAVDEHGEFIYVADTGHNRILKFLTTGALEDVAYSQEKIILDPPIQAPRYLCARDSLLFLSDPQTDRLVLLHLVVN
jgi:DNA-binding beta-propeller fold protein YncE